MSMRTYGVSEYGLYITEKDLEEYAKKNNMDVDEVAQDADMQNYSDADGEAVSLFSEIKFDVDEHFYIGCVDRYPTLFAQAYDNKTEALQELKDKYAEYLPKDFDYEGKFVHYVGTVWC